MLDFMLIFAAALAGFVHAPIGAVAAVATGLMAMSFYRHFRIYDRGMTMGLASHMRRTLLLSGWHALAAAAMAFGGGAIIRLVVGA